MTGDWREEGAWAGFLALQPWLPSTVSDILDIGCGNCPRLDVHLARHYGGAATMHLLDGDRRIPPIGKEQVGFRQSTKAWKDRFAGVAYLRDRVPDCRIVDHPPDPQRDIPCDLIVSFRAWGHHFPIGAYLDLARFSLRPGGRIVVDIRAGTDGLDVLRDGGFELISPNLELRSLKCGRWVLARP